jgi:hypothetical protein
LQVSTGYGFHSGLLLNSSIAFNHIYTVGMGSLSDMACVYNWGGVQNDFRIEYNLCGSVESYSKGYGGWVSVLSAAVSGILRTFLSAALAHAFLR